MQRRNLLTAIGSASAALYTGCLSTAQPGDAPKATQTGTPATDTPPEDMPSERTPSPSDGEGDVEPEVQSTQIETIDSGCMNDAGARVDVSVIDGRMLIEGVAETATPCYDATIESATVTDGTLQVQIGFEATDEMCVDCVGAVAYEAVVNIADADGVGTITVIHGEDGASYTHRRGSDAPAPASPTDSDGGTPLPHASQQPDSDLDMYLVNKDESAHEYAVTVQRASGAIVFDATTEVAAESRIQVYNLKLADPDGIETFTITTSVDSQEKAIDVKTSACYGDAFIEVGEDGELYPYYSIC